jgi:hypothetical protein
MSDLLWQDFEAWAEKKDLIVTEIISKDARTGVHAAVRKRRPGEERPPPSAFPACAAAAAAPPKGGGIRSVGRTAFDAAQIALDAVASTTHPTLEEEEAEARRQEAALTQRTSQK